MPRSLAIGLSLIVMLLALGGCTKERSGICPAPTEALSWHYLNDSFHSWCALCDYTLTDEEIVARAARLGWTHGDTHLLTPCLFASSSPTSPEDCARMACEDEDGEGGLLTTDTSMWRMIRRQIRTGESGEIRISHPDDMPVELPLSNPRMQIEEWVLDEEALQEVSNHYP